MACETTARVPTASTLLAEELFATGDEAFLEALYAIQVPRGVEPAPQQGASARPSPRRFARRVEKLHPLGAFARKWLDDPRPWARAQLRAYVEDGLDRPGHRTLVKRLYKGVEERGDLELLPLFFVAFDRMRRLRKRTRRRFDYQERAWIVQEDHVVHRPRAEDAFHFSQRTRNYLQARVARRVRELATRDPEAHRRVVLAALVLYEDADFPVGASLLHLRAFTTTLFARSELFERSSHSLRARAAARLSLSAPSPHAPEVWRESAPELVDALARAASLLVRRLLVAWLERDLGDQLGALPPRSLEALVASPHPDVSLFGARLIERSSQLEQLSVDAWLDLFDGPNLEIMPILARKMASVVTPARASIEQCVRLARHEAQAPAMLGIEWAEGKSLGTKEELEAALPIVDASVEEVRARGFAWLRPALVEEELSVDAHLRELLDVPHADVRAKAFALLEETPRWRDSIVFWAALTESPYGDARAFLLGLLARRRFALEASNLGEKNLHHLWATTLLEIHRGSRAKQRALTQLGERIESQPQQADALLPLLVLALRSVRESERRGALSALVRAAVRREEVRLAIARHAPSLEIPALAEVGS